MLLCVGILLCVNLHYAALWRPTSYFPPPPPGWGDAVMGAAPPPSVGGGATEGGGGAAPITASPHPSGRHTNKSQQAAVNYRVFSDIVITGNSINESH